MKTASENVLKALAKVMADARAGNVDVVAIIHVTPEGVPEVTFGGEMELAPSVNIGADLLKTSLLHHVMKIKQQPVNQIVRPATAALDS